MFGRISCLRAVVLKYKRIAVGKLYSTFSDHSTLYLYGLYPILRNKDLSDIRVAYFRFVNIFSIFFFGTGVET